MQDYDRALKLLLRRAAPNAIKQLSGITVTKWLDVELPKTQGLRMDLLGEDHDGELHHFELQSFNDAKINVRMAEYKLGTLRLTGKFSHQIVLYVGEAPPSMPTELAAPPDFLARYRIVDIRDLDGEELLASPDLGDNVIAILTRLRDHREAVRAIVAKISGLPETERHVAVQQLIILAGLRRLEQTVTEEVEKMPLVIDIMENQIIGPAIRKGLAEGLEKGRKEGLEQGEQKLLRQQMKKRFGPIPEWADAKLSTLPIATIEALGDRIFDVSTLEDLLK